MSFNYCLAEGSKDLYPVGASGNRSYLTSSSTATSTLIGNVYNRGKMFVYAVAGETIYLGSSAQGIGTGTVLITAPNGNTYTTGNSTTVGRINNRTEELAGPSALAVGGYNAYSRLVGAAETGVWTIEFVSCNTSATALGNGFSPPAATANWTTSNQTAVQSLPLIVAWDITVRSAGVSVPGRAYINVFTGNAGTAAATFYGKFNVLTNDGYQYTVASNGIQPFLFAFFANNKGVRNKSTGAPIYKSVDLNAVVTNNGTYSYQNPTLPDDATNVTHKLFYNTPSLTLPANASIYSNGATASTWLLTTPVNPVVSNVYFTGPEGTLGYSGTPPLAGGYIHFTANKNASYKVEIDINNNGSTTDPIDRTLIGSASAGDNAVFWDGKDGFGNDVINNTQVKLTVKLFSGEVHFPYLDIENNANGIIINRINGANSPDPTVYWNDQLLVGSGGTPAGASSPINASADPGINSITNGHIYTNNFGDNSFLDTWAYIYSAPIVQTLNIIERQADLEVVNNQPSITTACVGNTITYTTTVRNNGPDSARGAVFSFSFPQQFTLVNVSNSPAAGAVVLKDSIGSSAYFATLSLANNATITFTITGTITALPSGSNLITSSGILRPADVTDPDATNGSNISPTGPTDVNAECNGLPSGAGCNNIKTSTVTVSPIIVNNTVSTPQILCSAGTPATLTGLQVSGSPTYLWQSSIVSATAGFTTAGGANNGKDYTPPLTSQTTWFRRVVVAGACSDTSAAVRVLINPPLLPGAIAANQSFCTSGDPQIFTEITAASGGNNTYSYKWQSSTDNVIFTTIAGATATSYDAPVVTQSTWYRRIVSSTGSGCTDAISDTLMVRIDAAPTTSNAGPDQFLCNVTTTTLAGNQPVVGTGSWSQITGPNTALIAAVNQYNSTISNLASGTYTFVWSIQNGICAASTDTVLIVIAPLPSVANAGPDQVLCNATTATLAANTPASGLGSWKQVSGPNTATFVDFTQPAATVQGLVPGVYTFVWGISTGYCPASTDTMVLTVNMLPTVANAGPDQTQYNSGVFTMNANTPASGTGVWSVASGNASISNPNSPTSVVTLNPNTTATLVWTITNGNCPPSTDTVILIFKQQADIQVTKVAAPGNTYKTGSLVSYTITVENGGPSAALGFTIQDNIPANITNPTWVSTTTGNGVTITPANGNGQSVNAQANIPFAAGNKIVITVQGMVASTAIGGDSVNNTATLVNSTAIPDPNTSNNVSSVSGIVPNNPPVAVPDTFTTPRDVTVTGNVILNDHDPENGTLTVTTTPVAGPTHGTVILNANGTFSYTPGPGYTGTDNFIYQVCDNQGACAQTTTTIFITPAIIDLTVVKTASPATAVAGQTLTYTITVTNNGPSTIQQAETFNVSDTIANGFIPQDYIASSGTYFGSNGNWTGVTLAPGQSATLTIPGTIIAGYTGSNVFNSVSATPPPGTTDPTPASNSITTPVNRAVQVTVQKTDNSASYVPGTNNTYTITINNAGPSDLTGASFIDSLPVGITSGNWSATTTNGAQIGANSGVGSINQPVNLPANSSIIITSTIIIPSGYNASLVNKAAVVVPSTYQNINPANNTATDIDTALPKYDVQINKTGPASIIAGTSISYHVTVSNNGPSDVKQALIQDIIPTAIENITWQVQASGSATSNVNSGSGPVVITAGLPAGSNNKLDITITGTCSSSAIGQFTNTASVQITGQPIITSNQVNTVVINKTGLTVIKQSIPEGIVKAGNPIQYTITILNNGPSDATGVQLLDTIASIINNVTWTVAASGGANITGVNTGSGRIIGSVADIPAGDGNIVTITVNGTVDADGSGNLKNTAIATIPGVVTANGSNIINILNAPNLQISKTGPTQAIAGSGIDYTILVTNSGPSNAHNVQISDILSVSLSNVSWSAAASGGATISNGMNGTGNTLNITGDIPAGENSKIVIQIHATIASAANGTIKNSATVQLTNQTPVTSNEVSTTITNQPGITISKIAPAISLAGGRLRYTIQVTNHGPSDASGIIVTDTIPAQFIKSTSTAAAKGNASVISSGITNGIFKLVANIPAGDSNVITILLGGLIDPAYTGQVLNQAFVSTADSIVIPSPLVSTIINSDSKIQIVKSAPDTVIAGQQITYQLKVSNLGLSDAKQLLINDQLSNSLINSSWTATSTGNAGIVSGVTGSGNAVSVTGNIPAGANNTITITVTGTVSPTYTGKLSNVATGSITGKHLITSDTVVSNVINKSSLQIIKGGSQSVSAGGDLLYTLEVSNNGPSTASNVNITDIIPAVITAGTWTAVTSGGAAITSGGSGAGSNVLVIANIPTGGVVRVTINGKIPSSATGSILNTATAQTQGSTVSTTFKTNILVTPKLNISKSGPATINAGEKITYQLVVSDFGQSDAEGITIQDTVPSQLTNVSWTATGSSNAKVLSGSSGQGTNVLVTGTIPAGTDNHIFITVTGTVAPGYTGTLNNQAITYTQAGDTVKSEAVITTVNSRPSLQLVKSAPDTLAAGSKINYTIVITNNGPSDASAFTLSDIVPALVTNSSWTASSQGNASVNNSSGTGNNVNISGSIKAGTGNSITVNIQGATDPAATGTLLNTAVATINGDTAAVSNTTQTYLVSKSALLISKTGPAIQPAGGNISWIITASNNGPSTANGVLIQDTIPALITNSSWTAINNGTAQITSGNSGTGNIISVGGNIPVGATNNIQVTVTGKLAASALPGTIINTAFASAVNQPTVSDTAVTTVKVKPGLEIVKSGPSAIRAGDMISYTIVITNHGPSDVVNATIVDSLNPAILHPHWIATVSGNASVSKTEDSSAINITGNVGAADSNKILITVTGIVDPTYAENSLVNIASVTPVGLPGLSSEVTSTVSKAADLQIVKSGPAKAIAGETITYSISVTNAGPSVANGISITDIMPAELTNVQWSATAKGQGATVSSNSGTGNIQVTADLPAGNASIDFTVTAKIPANTSPFDMVNTATATPPSDVVDNTPASASVTTTIEKAADLVIVKSGPADLKKGQDISWQLVVTNRGLSDANNILIEDTIPNFVKISSVVATVQGVASAQSPVINGNDIQITGDINAGAGNAILVTIQGRVSTEVPANSLTNTAIVSPAADTRETSPANNTSSITTKLNTDVGIQISKSGPATVNVGDSINYEITVSNSGFSAATGVMIDDIVPAGITGVNWVASTNGDLQITSADSVGNTNNIHLEANIGASNSGTITIKIRGLVSSSVGGTITNTASATYGGVKKSIVVTTVDRSVHLQVNKTAPATINAGQQITYVVKVTNAGPAAALKAKITDILPPILNPSWTATATSGASVSPANGTDPNILLLADIPVSTDTITLVVHGTVDPTFSGALTNIVKVKADTNIVNTGDAGVTVVTNVVSKAGINIQKVGPSIVKAGSEINYKLILTNNGPSAATSVKVEDQLPVEILNSTWTATAADGASIIGLQSGSGNPATAVGLPVGGTVVIDIKGTTDPAANTTISNVATGSNNGEDLVSNVLNTQIVNKPSIAIQKSGPASIAAGGLISYQLKISNSGPSTATGANISDIIPVDIENVVWSATAVGSATINGGNIVNRSGNVIMQATIPAGEANYIQVVVNGRVSQAALPCKMVNKAEVVLPDGTRNEDSIVTTVNNVTGLRMVKSGPDTIAAGGTMSYTIDIYNDGPSDAVCIPVIDANPLLNGTWSATGIGAGEVCGGDVSNQTGTMFIGINLPAGNPNNSIHIVMSGQVDSSYTGQIENTAFAFPTYDVNNFITSNTVITEVVNKPIINLVKTGPGRAVAGGPISYNIVLTNNGPSLAQHLEVTDTLPVQLINTSWSATAEGTATIDGGNKQNQSGNINFFADVPGGTENRIVVTVTGTINPDFTGTITNIAGYKEQGKTNVQSTPVRTEVSAEPVIRFYKTGPDTIAAGTTITYTLHALNKGLSDAHEVEFTDTVPSLLQNVVWNAATTGGASIIGPSNGSGSIVKLTGSIPAKTGDILVTVTGEIPGSADTIVQNKATIGVKGNQLSDSVTTVIVNRTGVVFTKSGAQKAKSGDQISYTMDLVNSGPSALINARITDQIPASIQQTSWKISTMGLASVQSGTNLNGTGNLIAFNGNVPAGPGNVIHIQINGTIDPGFTGIITNTGIVTSADDSVYQSVATTIVSREAAIGISKSGPATAAAGEVISYQLNVTNVGPSTANNISITDQIPAILADVSWTATAIGNAKVIGNSSGSNYNLQVSGSIDAGAENGIQILISGKIPANANGSIKNVGFAQQEAEAKQSSDTIVTVIQNKPAITLSKLAPVQVNAGDSITYTIVARNIGSSDATAVNITDEIAASITGINWNATTTGTASIVGPNAGTGNHVNLIANIPAGESNVVRLIITGKVLSSAKDSIINQATAKVNDVVVSSNKTNTVVDTKSRLVIKKTGASQVTAGDTISYLITATNEGPSSASNIVITDVVPVAVSDVVWNATAIGSAGIVGASNGTGNNITISGSIDAGPGNKIQILIKGKVADTSTVTTITNTASIKQSGEEITGTSSVVTGVKITPDIKIVKSGPATVVAGDSITYRLKITNTGLSAAKGVVIADSVVASVTGVNWNTIAYGKSHIVGKSSGQGNVLFIADLLISIDDSVIVIINGLTSSNLTGSIDNRASAAFNNTVVQSNVVSTNVVNEAGLSITKVGDKEVVAGDSIHYLITVTNAGPSEARNVAITDDVPSSISGVSYSASNGAIGTGNHIAFTTDLAAGASLQIRVAGKVSSDATGELSNTASAQLPGERPVTSVAAVTTIAATSQITITKVGDKSVVAGDSIHYLITVTNAGPSEARNVAITDDVPSAISGVSYNASNGATGTGNHIAFTTDLAAGASLQIRVSGKVSSDATGELSNTASAQLPGERPVTSVAAVTTVTSSSQINITKVGDKQVVAGDSIHYLITVTNAGPSDAKNVAITDDVPSSISGVSYSASNGATDTGNHIAFTSDLAVGASIQIRVVGKVSSEASGELTNTASAQLPGSSPVTSVAAVTTVTSSSQISITKVGDKQVVAGDSIHYLITVTNAGPSEARNVAITDDVPSAISGVSYNASNGATGTGNHIAFTTDLAAGASIQIRVVGKVSSEATGELSNTASAQLPGERPVTSVAAVTTVTSSSQISITKVGDKQVVAGDSIHYLITVTNAGPSEARNVAITDDVPSSISGVSYSASNGATGTGNHIAFTTDLAVGASLQIRVTGKVSSEATGALSNTASAQLPGSSPVTSAAAVTTVTSSSQISITKVGDKQVVAGDSIHYLIIVTNAGPSEARNVAITDDVPSSISGVSYSATNGATGTGNHIAFTSDLAVGASIQIRVVG
ncbi:DUF11 domain-containing protein, partial [Chitinophaga silvatica]